MRTMTLEGDWPVTAGWKYSSGNLHAAYDLGCPTGTRVFAPFAGTVADCNDGVPNNRPGEGIWSGKPSNWILLWGKWRGADVNVYLQHLSPGLRVKRGERVHAGQPIAISGNSGNSTGPHLHYSAAWSHTMNRYFNMVGGGHYAIYPPTKVEQPAKDPTPDPIQEDTEMIVVKQGSRALLVHGNLTTKIDAEDATRMGEAGVPVVGVSAFTYDNLSKADQVDAGRVRTVKVTE